MRRKQREGLRTRRQWEGRRAVSIGLGRRLGQRLVGSRAFLALRCCASDRGEGRLSWWRGAGISVSRPRGWLGPGRGCPGQVHGGWHALGSCGLLSSRPWWRSQKAHGKIRQKRRRLLQRRLLQIYF
eukprot:scaffold111926_cov57-Phaeocystis_antarctica.AAC.1